MASTTVILKPRCPLCGGAPLSIGAMDRPADPCVSCIVALDRVTQRMDSYHAVAAREAVFAFAQARGI